MRKLGVVEDTLFVPMLGRIHASEHCPQILYDKKALELKNKLPLDLIKQNKQNQYTLLASASRSANMDRFIRSFLERRPDGVIVQLGCGLETTYYCSRNWNEKPILQEMPFPKTGSDKFVQNFPMLLFSLLQAGCFIILKKIRSLPFCVRWDNLEIWKLFLTP